MRKTTKSKVRAGVRTKSSAARVTTRTTADMPAVKLLEDLFKDINDRVAQLAPGPAKRAIVADLRRYERVTWQWVSGTPSDAQREAVREQLQELAESLTRALDHQRAVATAANPTRRFRHPSKTK
ncbi:MAG: hypothetical protein JST00_09810 [Deltaproteobacteria bacterium]|nr:hypothetical protein [Deltaproteobacteria bacterium]